MRPKWLTFPLLFPPAPWDTASSITFEIQHEAQQVKKTSDELNHRTNTSKNGNLPSISHHH
jgi:hypothetical protein